MELRDLLWAHRYADVIEAADARLVENPDDWMAIELLAPALRATGKYEDALPLYERLTERDRSETLTPGRPGRQIDIACLYWVMGDRPRAVRLMHGLAQGILNGTIQYGDAAGGMKQGLLLYYMGVTVDDAGEASFALSYLRNRAERINKHAHNVWPIPVARYYFGEIDFEEVLFAAAACRDTQSAIEAARLKLMSRRKTCVVLFHDGVRLRASGKESECLSRIRECYSLENPMLEPEWYLARYEVDKADAAIAK